MRRKDVPDGLFGLPKSSFGEHKLVTKYSSIPEKQHIASQLLLSFVTILQTLPLPNEDVGRPHKHFRVRFRSTFQGREYFTWATKRFTPPKRRLGKDEQKMKCGFSKHYSWACVLYFGRRTIEKSIENPDVIFCSSFPNLRLGSIQLGMLSSCDSFVFYIHITIEAGLSCTFLKRARMHAL